MISQKLVLARGLPGSGKSTFAERLVEAINRIRPDKATHHENDQFHMVGGKYCFDKDRQADAVLECKEKTVKDLIAGRTVVVSNVFVSGYTLGWYLNVAKSLGIPAVILRMDQQFPGIHNVPENVFKSMKENFQDIDGEIFVKADGDDYTFSVFHDDVEVLA